MLFTIYREQQEISGTHHQFGIVEDKKIFRKTVTVHNYFWKLLDSLWMATCRGGSLVCCCGCLGPGSLSVIYFFGINIA